MEVDLERRRIRGSWDLSDGELEMRSQWPTVDGALGVTQLDDCVKKARNFFWGIFFFFHGSGSSIAFTFGPSSDITLIALKLDHGNSGLIQQLKFQNMEILIDMKRSGEASELESNNIEAPLLLRITEDKVQQLKFQNMEILIDMERLGEEARELP